MNKKGEWGFEEVAKLILALVVLAILIGMSIAFKEKIIELMGKLFKIF